MLSEDNDLTPDTFPAFLSKCREENKVLPLEGDELVKAMADLKSRRVPILREPMKLSNQADIKKWLYSSGGWRPTIWGTKDIRGRYQRKCK